MASVKQVTALLVLVAGVVLALITTTTGQNMPEPPPGHGGPGPFGFGAPGQFGGGFRGRRSDFDMAGYRQEARREAQGPFRGRREAYFGMQDE